MAGDAYSRLTRDCLGYDAPLSITISAICSFLGPLNSTNSGSSTAAGGGRIRDRVLVGGLYNSI